MSMIEIVSFSSQFLVLSLYSFCIGIVLYTVAHASNRFMPFVRVWRDYWMVLILLSSLPLVFCIFSYNSQELSVFNLSQLKYTMGDTLSITPLIEAKKTEITQSFNLMAIVSNLWLCIYLIGVLYAFKGFFVQIRLVKSIINNSIKLCVNKAQINNQYYLQLIKLQEHCKIKIVFSPLAISPFVYQLRSKYLVLPQSLFNDKNLTQHQIDLIIGHEMVHIKNNDQLIVMFSHILICFLWFNPFVKLFQENMNWAIEANCDSEVLIQKPHSRKIYAQTMLKILRQSATTTSNHKVAAFSMKTHRSLTMRINNIIKPMHPEVKLKPKKKKLWISALSLGALMFITQPQTFASPNATKQAMINPVKQAKISSAYGAKNKFHDFHKGIDLSAKIDTPIVASAAGVVRISTDLLENKKNYGTLIIIDHIDGFHSVYAHLNSRNVSAGDKVETGQLIGYVGETGKATGPHLHLELLKDNKHVNPSDYIQF